MICFMNDLVSCGTRVYHVVTHALSNENYAFSNGEATSNNKRRLMSSLKIFKLSPVVGISGCFLK